MASFFGASSGLFVLLTIPISCSYCPQTPISVGAISIVSSSMGPTSSKLSSRENNLIQNNKHRQFGLDCYYVSLPREAHYPSPWITASQNRPFLATDCSVEREAAHTRSARRTRM